MDMDKHIWKGKGLVDYCDSEDEVNSSGSLNENNGFDIYPYDGANECDDEVNAKTSDDEIGSEDLVPTTDDHGRGQAMALLLRPRVNVASSVSRAVFLCLLAALFLIHPNRRRP